MVSLGLPCPLRMMTGLDCPLCGATRATHALLQGDVVAALDFNALYVVTLPVVALILLVWIVRGQGSVQLRGRATTWALAAIAVGFAVARNLPIDALSVLSSSPGTQ